MEESGTLRLQKGISQIQGIRYEFQQDKLVEVGTEQGK